MVARAIAVASATMVMPPRPMLRASAAAQRRRVCSGKKGARCSNRWRTALRTALRSTRLIHLGHAIHGPIARKKRLVYFFLVPELAAAYVALSRLRRRESG